MLGTSDGWSLYGILVCTLLTLLYFLLSNILDANRNYIILYIIQGKRITRLLHLLSIIMPMQVKENRFYNRKCLPPGPLEIVAL